MIIKRGTTRFVILVGRYAIKLPRFDYWHGLLRGLIGNGQEHEWSRSWCNEGTCPILWAAPLGMALLMPRCAPVPFEVTPAWHRTFVDRGSHCVPAECKQDSFGMLPSGAIVAVDFA